MLKLDQPDPFDDAKFPQAHPITPCVSGYFLSFKRDGQDILRVNVEDVGAMQMLHAVLSRIAGARLVPTELEQICDLLADAIRSSEMGS
jgi:hypothetical protein